VARFGIENPDPAVRLDAVRDMLRSLDEGTITMLKDRLAKETDARVKKAMESGIALAALDSADVEEKLKAINTLRDSLNSDVRNRLGAFLEKSPEGNFVEPDQRVRDAAQSVIRTIDSWRWL